MEAILQYLAQKNIDPATLGLGRGNSKGNLETLLGLQSAKDKIAQEKADHHTPKKETPKEDTKTTKVDPKKGLPLLIM
jgi:hypothetical protein